jgi:hypothetical protein
MRRPFALALASFLSLALLAVPTGRAGAQEPPVRLTLLEQSPQWNDPEHPGLTLSVRAMNTGQEPLDDLRIGVTLWPPVFSRTGFEESLRTDPADAAPLLAETRSREGVLAPGDARDFVIPVDLPLDQVSPTQSLIYPLKVDLRTGYRSLAAIRTPVIYLVRRPLSPLQFSWTFVLHAPLAVGPDGTFESPALETSISRGGRLAGEISALTHLAGTGIGVDVVISPTLLFQLLQMRDGYRVIDGGSARTVEPGRGGSAAAAGALDRLRAIATSPNVELSALPYSEPLLPALTSGGLARDLGVQLQRGRQLVADTLGASPTPAVLRPPRSAIDEGSLDELPAAGVTTLVLDPAVVPRADDAQGFAPSPLVSLAAQNATLSAVVGDPAVQALLTSGIAEQDPVLASQAMLGEIASIWLQRPGEPHGLAMLLGEDVAASGAFYAPLVRGIAGAPWLAKRTATSLAADQTVPRSEGAAQIASSQASFDTTYVNALKQARRRVEILRTMLVDPSSQPAHLDQLLLLAESQRFVGDEGSGVAFIDRVDRAVEAIFGAVRPEVSQPITLTSSAIHNVPIAVRNSAGVPLRVTIRLVSDHLLSTVEVTRVLPPDSTQTISVDLELRTTGKFEVPVQIVSPSGRVIGQRRIVLRSTAYNRVALVITIGAALLALVVWARRFLPRRTV